MRALTSCWSVTAAYAEYVCVSRHMLIEKPSGWGWELAAAIPEVCPFPETLSIGILMPYRLGSPPLKHYIA